MSDPTVDYQSAYATKEIADLRRENAELQKEIDRLHDVLRFHKNDFEQVAKERDDLRRQLAESDERRKGSIIAIDNLIVQAAEKDAEIERLRGELKRTEKEVCLPAFGRIDELNAEIAEWCAKADQYLGKQTELEADIENLNGEIERLNRRLQNRDNCSYMGPMRDCPTHGESEALKLRDEYIQAAEQRFRLHGAEITTAGYICACAVCQDVEAARAKLREAGVIK